MPNNKGGKNYKKSKKGGHGPQTNGELPTADTPDKTYATVKKRLGGKIVEVVCRDGKERQARIPGTFYKRVWFNPGDIILVQIDPIDPTAMHILYKYMPNESVQLKAKGLIDFDINGAEEDNGFVFGDEEEEEEEGDVYDQVDKVNKETEKEKLAKKAVSITLQRKDARATKSGIDDNGNINIDDI